MGREVVDRRRCENDQSYQHRRVILKPHHETNIQPREYVRLAPFFDETVCPWERFLDREPVFFGAKNFWEERVFLSNKTKQELMSMRHLSPMELVGLLWERNPKILDQILDRKQSLVHIEGLRVDLAFHLSVFVVRLKLKSGRYITASATWSTPALQGLFSRVIAFLWNEPDLAHRCFWNYNYHTGQPHNDLWFTEAAQDLWKCRNNYKLHPLSLPTGFVKDPPRRMEIYDANRKLEDRLGYDVSRVHGRVRCKSVAPDMLKSYSSSASKSDFNAKSLGRDESKPSTKSCSKSRGSEGTKSSETTASKAAELKINCPAISKSSSTAKPRTSERDVLKVSRPEEWKSCSDSSKSSQLNVTKSCRSDADKSKTPEVDVLKSSRDSESKPAAVFNVGPESARKEPESETTKNFRSVALKHCSPMSNSTSSGKMKASDSNLTKSCRSAESKSSDMSKFHKPLVVRCCSVSQSSSSGAPTFSGTDNPKSSELMKLKSTSHAVTKFTEHGMSKSHSKLSKCSEPVVVKSSQLNGSKSVDINESKFSEKISNIPGSSKSDAPKIFPTPILISAEHARSIPSQSNLLNSSKSNDSKRTTSSVVNSECDIQKLAAEFQGPLKIDQKFSSQKREAKGYSGSDSKGMEVERHPRSEDDSAKAIEKNNLLINISSSDEEVEHKPDLKKMLIPKNYGGPVATMFRPVLTSRSRNFDEIISKKKGMPPKSAPCGSRSLLTKFVGSVLPGSSKNLRHLGKPREMSRIREWRNKMADQTPVMRLRGQFPKRNYSLLMFNKFEFVESIRYETTFEEPEEPEIDDKVIWLVELKLNGDMLKFYGQSKLRWDKAFNNAMIMALHFCSKRIVHQNIVPRHLRNETQFLMHCFLNPGMRTQINVPEKLPEVELKRKQKLIYEQTAKGRKRSKSVCVQIDDDSNDERSIPIDDSFVFEVNFKTDNRQFFFEQACYRRKRAITESVLQVLKSNFDYFVM